MESSSKDGMEAGGPTSVSNYHFEDEDDQPVSFSVLPLRLDGVVSASPGSLSSARQLMLFGKVDNGLQDVKKQVAGWRYDLSSSALGPVVSVLSKEEGVWIVLEGQPEKRYAERQARGVIVALTCLHFVRMSPEASQKMVWDHLANVFSWFEVKPDQDDLKEQAGLIAQAVKGDASLSKSEFLLAFLVEMRDHGEKNSRKERIKNSRKKTKLDSELDADSERRILNIMKEVDSAITLEVVRKQYQGPLTKESSSESEIDKVKLREVKGTVEAVRTAVKKLDIDDAKAVCGLEIDRILTWQSKLKEYLGPYLDGPYYSSYGRHFTKIEKLEEIVNILHWYVENGDMIVDFCCGANDFSVIMNKKLEETGKKCAFKNFDIFHPKNHFNFEKRDWMDVQVNDLTKEGRPMVIVGLNPPSFEATRFIEKALQFEPKLLILIVPPETEGLDTKSYDLVWRDTKFCLGKLFYLPGSDVNDIPAETLNLKPPVLYLWSRSDCSAKYRAIAEKEGHLSSVGHVGSHVQDSYERETRSHFVQDGCNEVDASMVVVDCYAEGGDDTGIENRLADSKIGDGLMGEIWG